MSVSWGKNDTHTAIKLGKRRCATCKEPTANVSLRCDLCRAIGVPEPVLPDQHDQSDAEALAERYDGGRACSA